MHCSEGVIYTGGGRGYQSTEIESEVSEVRAKIQKNLWRNRENKERNVSPFMFWGTTKARGLEESGTQGKCNQIGSG